MELATITMDRERAETLFKEYRALGDRATDEDKAIMQGYKQIAKGHTLINVVDAIAAGGFDERGLPRLAFSRADQDYMRVERDSLWSWSDETNQRESQWGLGDLHFYPDERFRYDYIAASLRLEIEASRLQTAEPLRDPRSGHWRAMVPIIPAGLRPKHKLSGYHLLWEAEWEIAPRPPGDPALLKQLGGELYIVLAIWDLTEIERMILGQRVV